MNEQRDRLKVGHSLYGMTILERQNAAAVAHRVCICGHADNAHETTGTRRCNACACVQYLQDDEARNVVRICSMCKKNMGEKEPYQDKGVTHGYCDECMKKLDDK